MADFPAYSACPYTSDSTMEILDDLRTDAADDGTVRRRAFFAAPKYRFNLKFKITSTEWSALNTHYLANRVATFNFNFAGNGSTYVCGYESAGPRVQYKGGNVLVVDVALRSS